MWIWLLIWMQKCIVIVAFLSLESGRTMDSQTNSTDVEESGTDKQHSAPQLQYAIEDVPPWYLWILLGFQVSTCICVVASGMNFENNGIWWITELEAFLPDASVVL